MGLRMLLNMIGRADDRRDPLNRERFDAVRPLIADAIREHDEQAAAWAATIRGGNLPVGPNINGMGEAVRPEMRDEISLSTRELRITEALIGLSPEAASLMLGRVCAGIYGLGGESLLERAARVAAERWRGQQLPAPCLSSPFWRWPPWP